MTKKLALLCDAQRLFSHENTTDRSLVVGLSLQLTFTEGFDVTSDDDLRWVELWHWEPIVDCDVWFFGGTLPPGGQLLPAVATWPLPGAVAPAECIAALDRRLDELRNFAKRVAFEWDINNPQAPPPQEGHVLQVQAAAARIATTAGYGLNLSMVLKLDHLQLPYAGNQVPNDARILIVPRLQFRRTTAPAIDVKYTPKTAPLTAPAHGESIAWEYDASVTVGNATDAPQLTALIAPFDIESHDTSGRFIQLSTGWVRSTLGATATPPDQSDDWTLKLLQRVAENWDLARHLLDAVSGHVAIPDFRLYWQMIVAALRDRASLGLIDTTDGNGLLRFAIQQAVPLVTSTQLPTTQETVLRDGYLRSLQALLRIKEQEGAEIPSKSVKAWWESLCDALSPDLQERAKSITDAPQPSRQVHMAWPPGLAVDTYFAVQNAQGGPYVSTASLRVYANRDDDVTAPIAVIPTLIDPAHVRTADGGMETLFDAYAQGTPLPSGWYEITLTIPSTTAPPGSPSVHTSPRSLIRPTLAEDLGPLIRVWNELQLPATLARMIEPAWNLAANSDVALPQQTNSRPWYTTIWTSVDDAAGYPISYAELGEIRPADGRNWVVTLGNVTHRAVGTDVSSWIDGAEYALEFAASYQPGGVPDKPTAMVRVKLQTSGAGQKQLQLKLTLHDSTGDHELDAKTFDASGGAYHLRCEWKVQRDGKAKLAAFVGESVTTWTPSVTATFADRSLGRCGLRLINNLGGTNHVLVASAPSLLAAPDVLDNLPQLRDAWYTSFKPVESFWQQVGPSTLAALPRFDLPQRLALGQTARLVTVWNKQLLTNDTDYAGYLNRKFTDLITTLAGQRFDLPAGAKVNSIFRDFLPEISAAGISAELAQVVTDHLKRVAARISLVPNPKQPGFGEQPSDRYRVPTPHAVNIQVDRPAMFSDTITQTVDEDLLRQLSGFGLLMQQADRGAAESPNVDDYFKDQPWRILNCVDVCPRNTLQPDPKKPLYAFYDAPAAYRRQVVSLPLQYQNQVRQVTIAYQNQHLGALSPLADIADVFDFGNQQDGQPDLQQALPPFLHKIPSPAAGGNHDWGLLPTLKFGQFYRTLVFVSGNCGNLPALLTAGASAHPAALRTSTITTAEFEAESLRLGNPAVPAELKYFQQIIHESVYLRRVGIGTPRLERPEWPASGKLTKPDRPLLPEVPPEVRPLAKEWGIVGLTSSQPALRWNYDDLRREGDIANTENWLLIVPRVIVAGTSDDSNDGSVTFTISIGLRSTNGAAIDTCGVKIERNGSKLTVDGVTANDNLVHPDIGTLSSGPLDFRLGYVGGNLYLSWRRSDRQEAWLPWRADGELVGAAAPVTENAWVEISCATRADRELVITFGTPEFSTGSTALAAQSSAQVRDDQMGTRPLAAPTAPLIVLRPDPRASSDLTFRLRPPATDLETWDAWTQMDQGVGAAQRKAIWSRHKYLSSTGGDEETTARLDPNSGPRYDGSIDDPAVENLLVELVPLRTDAPKSVLRALWSPAANTLGFDPITGAPHPNPLNDVQRLPAKFVIKALTLWDSAPGDRLVLLADETFQVTVQEQEIWQLRIYPLVRASFFDASAVARPGRQRFHSGFCEGGEYTDDAGTKYRLFDPWSLTIEAATDEVVQLVSHRDELKFRQDVLAASPQERNKLKAESRDARQQILLASLAPDFNGQVVTAALMKSSPRVFRYAGRIRLLRQVWRWRGRPVPPFPLGSLSESGLDQFPATSAVDVQTAAELETPALPMLWDAIGFGDRSAVDLLDESRSIVCDQPRANLFREDVSGDRRSLYYRFTLHALSRYEPLYAEVRPIVMASESPPKANPTRPLTLTDKNDPRNAWRRLFVPCRREQTLPRPAVRFIVPLTESEEDSAKGGVPGLLVVLDDSWFAVGGLAETLQSEIVQTNDYWETRFPAGDKEPIVRPEFGPDPAETAAGWTRGAMGETQNPSGVPDKSLAMDLVGPIGHTFDTDADAPLYGASSFILRPPLIEGVMRGGNGERGLEWYFAKVRLRRMLLPEMFADYQVPQPVAAATLSSPIELQLSDAQPWIIDIVSVRLSASSAIRLAVKLTDTPPITSGTDMGGRGTVEIQGDSTMLNLRWTPQNTAAPTAAVDLAGNSGTWDEARIDIRLVLQRDGEPGTNNGQPAPPPRHLMVQYRLDGMWRKDPTDGALQPLEAEVSQRVWRTLATQLWKGDGTWPSQIAFDVTGDVTCAPPLVLPARLSTFSAPYWLQFLPDSQLLLPRFDSPENSLLYRPSEFWLAWQPQTTPPVAPAWKLFEQTSRGKEDVTKKLTNHPDAEPNCDMSFQRRILLTEMLSDVRGQLGHERYCGLYRLDKPGQPDATLVEVHASPVLKQQGLRADTLLPSATKIARRMRARVVEVQVVRHQSDGAPQLAEKVWTELFPVESDSQFSDVRARIVRVSPPIELQEIAGS